MEDALAEVIKTGGLSLITQGGFAITILILLGIMWLMRKSSQENEARHERERGEWTAELTRERTAHDETRNKVIDQMHVTQDVMTNAQKVVQAVSDAFRASHP